MVVDFFLVSATAGCWLAAVQKGRSIRRAADRLAVTGLAAGLAALGVATLFQVRIFAPYVDELTSVPTSSKLISHSFVLISAYSVQVMLVAPLTPGRARARTRIRRRAVLLIGCLAGMVGIVLLSPAHLAPMRVSDGVPMPNAAGTAYVALYAGFLGIATFDISRMEFRFARLVDRMFLRLGMFLGAIGTAVAVAYAVTKLGLVVGRVAGIESTVVETSGLTPAILISVLLSTVSAVLPTMASWTRLHPPVRWLTRLWTYRALGPLWARLVDGTDVPQLLPTASVLKAASSGLPLPFLLQRRVTEISDGLLHLREHIDAGVVAEARAQADRAGLPERERRAVVEAAAIEAALYAKARGISVAVPGPYEPPPFSDLDRKAWWLQLVSHAMRRSPIVRQVASRYRESHCGLVPAEASDRSGPT